MSPAAIAVTIVAAGDPAVKAAAVKAANSTAVEPATVETGAMKTTMKAAAMEAPATAARCVGEIWLGENRRAEQCSSNAQHGPPFLRLGFAIGYFAHRKLRCAPSRARAF
jgi:hypothetical protein